MEQTARQVVSQELQAVIIRADGRREQLGTIAYWHRNPLRRLWARIRGIKGKFNEPPALGCTPNATFEPIELDRGESLEIAYVPPIQDPGGGGSLTGQRIANGKG
jgi:hypothetical protein